MAKSPARPSPKARGQILPLGLVGLFALILLLAFTLRLSTRLIQRERTRMRTDVTLYSGGIQYSRGLNLLAATEQLLAGAWSFFLLSGGAGYPVVSGIQRIQTVLLIATPWLVEASTVGLGAANGLLAVPIWNKRVLLEPPINNSLKPDLNVETRDLLGFISDGAVATGQALSGAAMDRSKVKKAIQDELSSTQSSLGPQGMASFSRGVHALLPRADPGTFTKITGYHYTRTDGTKIELPADGAAAHQEDDGRGGVHTVYKDSLKNLYVIAQWGFNLALRIDLRETGEHYLTLVTVQRPGPDPEAPRPGWSFNVSQLKVDGGSVQMADFHGGGICWRPRLVPVRLLPPLNSLDRKSQELASLGAMLFDDLLKATPNEPWLRRAKQAVNLSRDILAVQH